MKSSEIRQAFIDFFSQRGHQVVESSSLVPANDPTLLFTNAGMVQFKDTFLGSEKRPYSKAVSSQRCVRAGGKHNDLDNVGYTARHHTFFEMLGNFSFGDYFKREAIQFAWQFLTQTLKLPAEKLWVSVYQDDDEAADIWLKEIGVSADKFSRCGEKDNFWSMGDTGPSGPCTEIFYDHGEEVPGGPPGSPDQEGDRYIEIWNLVFMQYNRDAEGKLHPLPKPSVDTGMGLERITAVVQGVHNNYEIDSFQHIIKYLADLVPTKALDHPSLKVVADHIRACAFLIVDGVLPGNEGRGYVLRRIIRRAIRHGHKLGLKSPFFYQLLNPLIDVMGTAYPELSTHAKDITRVLEKEEMQFDKTLDLGLNLLQEEIGATNAQVIPGEVAFKLYDTYGFPVDLTQDIAREQGLQVDMEGFERCMSKQRALSQSHSQFQAAQSKLPNIEATTPFKGYEMDTSQTEIMALFCEGNPVDSLSEGQAGILVLKETPFYAESGGQVGDKGSIQAGQAVFMVEDTQKSGDAILHIGHMKQGKLEKAQQAKACVDNHRRDAIRLNHTATHLLHAALKEIIGAHVHQKGSLVDAERARFDFSHFEGLTPAQITDLENRVNEKIRENLVVETQVMAIDEAKQQGAVALFGEKYSEEVRVLSMGEYSKELCGGTHAKRTGDIGLFKIIAEYGIASGVRRIEMMTGQAALDWVNDALRRLDGMTAQLKASPQNVLDKLHQLIKDQKQSEKEIDHLKAKLATNSGQSMLEGIETVGDIQLLVKEIEHADGKTLRTALDQLKSKLERAVIVLYARQQGKISVVAGVSKALIGKVPSAVEYVKCLCGKGGGREDMAQGGGKVPNDLEKSLEAIQNMIKQYK